MKNIFPNLPGAHVGKAQRCDVAHVRDDMTSRDAGGVVVLREPWTSRVQEPSAMDVDRLDAVQ